MMLSHMCSAQSGMLSGLVQAMRRCLSCFRWGGWSVMSQSHEMRLLVVAPSSPRLGPARNAGRDCARERSGDRRRSGLYFLLEGGLLYVLGQDSFFTF